MAAKVWKALGEKEDVEISKLPQILKEKGGKVLRRTP